MLDMCFFSRTIPTSPGFSLLEEIDAISVQGIPIGCHLGPIGVLNGNAVDGKKNLRHFADGKIWPKGSPRDLLDLKSAETLLFANRMLNLFRHQI